MEQPFNKPKMEVFKESRCTKSAEYLPVERPLLRPTFENEGAPVLFFPFWRMSNPFLDLIFKFCRFIRAICSWCWKLVSDNICCIKTRLKSAMEISEFLEGYVFRIMDAFLAGEEFGVLIILLRTCKSSRTLFTPSSESCCRMAKPLVVIITLFSSPCKTH